MTDKQMKHTPGTLEHQQPPALYGHADILVASGDEEYMVAELYEGSDELRAANARRLVACWNALIGIPTEDIEQVSRVEIGINITTGTGLLEQNKALREALEAARLKLKIYRENGSNQGYQGGMEYTSLIRMIDAALSEQGK